MNRKRHVLHRHPRAWLSAGCVVVAGCSLQDLDSLGIGYGQDGGLSGSLNISGTGGNVSRGGSGSSNGGNGGTVPNGTGGASGEAAGGSAGDGLGGGGSGGNAGNGGAGGSAGTEPINYGGSAGFISALGDGGPDGNLIPDPGFEDGIVGWVQQGGPTLTWTTIGPVAGSHCLRTSNRTAAWNGPAYPLKDLVIPGETYNLSSYMRVSHPNQPVKFTGKVICVGEAATFMPIIVGQATTSWQFFEASFIAPTCPLTEFSIFAEEAPGGVDIFIDEVRVVPLP